MNPSSVLTQALKCIVSGFLVGKSVEEAAAHNRVSRSIYAMEVGMS